MDGANAAARTAVNGILAASGSRAEPARTFKPYTAPEYRAAKQLDAKRYLHGEPHILEAPSQQAARSTTLIEELSEAARR
jgi:hypothetical protein